MEEGRSSHYSPWVALLSVQSSSCSMRTRMIYSVLSSVRPLPSIGSDLPLYIGVRQVHGSLGSLVYGQCAPRVQ